MANLLASMADKISLPLAISSPPRRRMGRALAPPVPGDGLPSPVPGSIRDRAIDGHKEFKQQISLWRQLPARRLPHTSSSQARTCEI